MNKRINEIIDECGLWIAYDNRSVTRKELEFFAEQVVEECVERIYPQWIKEHRHIDPTNLADAVMRVKQHFGVE